ncbi:MAG: hypothetical protein N3B12_07645 [Armatimonadetes bacterium]|nr:hypothetical protein [Armatimonadota bacterium]
MQSTGNTGHEKSNGCNGTVTLELSLSRKALAGAQRLSGVVVLRLKKPINIRSLVVSFEGRETPARTSVSKPLRGGTPFFSRDVLLTGTQRPRLRSDRISQYWNALLGRDTGRTLSEGEHIYPFSIPLPASLPATYDGKAGKIGYTASAQVRFATGRTLKTSCEVVVSSIPRAGRPLPFALSYPTANGNVHTESVSADLQLVDRAIPLGSEIAGHLVITNPKKARIRQVRASLECCEWIRQTAHREIHRRTVDEWSIKPADEHDSRIESEFRLAAPADAPPTIEGTAISVIWLLKLTIDADPPIEIKAPVITYAPVRKD